MFVKVFSVEFWVTVALRLSERVGQENLFTASEVHYNSEEVLWKPFKNMFGNRNRYNDRNQRGNSFTKTIVNIATIVSTAVTCIRLAYYGILSIQVAALIMLGVVVFVALGNNIAKVVLAAAALFLFVLLYRLIFLLQ